MAIYREHGKEQPYIPLGVFKLRLPFIHMKWEWPEALQGMILVAVALGSIAVHQEVLGVPFEVALVMVALNGILYLMHPMLGDPVFPGWITPAIPLVLAWAKGYTAGPDRIQAIIALQLSMAVVFLFLGVTGLAKKIVSFVPTSMRAGIILGAGIAAVVSVIGPTGRMVGQEVTILTGALICFVVMFSWRFLVAKDHNAFLQQLSKYGMLPGLLVALAIGPIIGEIPIPKLEMGFVNLGLFSELISKYTIFAVGFPGIKYFVEALPLVIACYIIAFGDFVLAEVVVKEADLVRDDEVIEFNPNRSNLISGLRNLIMGLFAPYGPLCGPLWAGGTIAIAERYKHGRKAMDSIYGGAFSFTGAMFIASLFLPIISILKPVLPAALSLTLLVQGFACAYIAMDMVKTKEERGVAGVMAMFLAVKPVAWGLAAGIILHFVIGVRTQAPAVPVNKEKSAEA